MQKGSATIVNLIRITSVRAIWFSLLWWALTEGEGGDWFGLSVVMFATVASLVLSPASTSRWRVMGLFSFVSFFLRESLRGGIDVAQRALHPRLSLAPVVLDYRLRLPDGPARMLMLSTVSLLPGTLSADFDGMVLYVHVLDGRLFVANDLKAVEHCVAGLYGIKLKEP